MDTPNPFRPDPAPLVPSPGADASAGAAPPVAPGGAGFAVPSPGSTLHVPRKSARAVVVLLGAAIVLGAGSLLMRVLLLRLIAHVESGRSADVDGGYSGPAPDLIDAITRVLGFAETAVYLATVPVFAVWFYRGLANAKAVAGGSSKITPGWGVGSFFVPFVNLVLPVLQALAGWRALGASYATGGGAAPGVFVVGVWWAVWIIGNVAGQIALRMQIGMPDDPTLDQLRGIVLADLAAAITGIASAIGAGVYVIACTRLQARVEAMHWPLAPAA